MKRYAIILYGKAHNIFYHPGDPQLPPDGEGNPVIVVEVTDPDTVEGWDYDEATGEFTPPLVPDPPALPIEPVQAMTVMPPAPQIKTLPQQIEAMQISLVLAGLVEAESEQYYHGMYLKGNIAESDLQKLADCGKVNIDDIGKWQEERVQLLMPPEPEPDERPKTRSGYEWL